MARFFSPWTLRLLAAFLLVLDLSQEPMSALPVVPPSAADNDTIADLSMKEAFWWNSEAAVGHELALALLSEQSIVDLTRDRTPQLALQATTRVRARCVVPTTADFVFPPATAMPQVTIFVVLSAPALDVSLSRNTALAHRRSTVLTI